MEHAAAHRNTDGESKGALYVVATPIGNLRDVSLRALDVLKAVFVIAAEDTRVTARLLDHYGITARLTSLHGHSEKRATPRLLSLLKQGKSIALVTDAGTPGISDPGAHLVAAVHNAGYPVIPVPGANAAVTALSAAGFAAPQFLFCGFLPQRAAGRRHMLSRLAHQPFTLVFFEAPHRIIESVADMSAALGPTRRVAIARELTKRFETVHVCLLGEAADWLGSDLNRRKGEFVLVVAGAPETVEAGADARRTLETLLVDLPLKQAVALAANITGAKRNELYGLALKLKEGR